MANKKISQLTSIGGTPSSGDIIPITDISDTSGSADGTTKKVTVAEMMSAVSVDGTGVTSTGETGGSKFLREDGDGSCSFQTVSVTDENLRGTDNPHIGAYPNQSLKVIDNPSQSVAVVTDSDGNIEFIVKTDASRAYLNTPSNRLELTTGVSVVEDTNEPDIEITTTSGTYSLVTGDSDALGANGLPIRQGFNAPNIGAFSSPLLISGGSIA